MCSEASALKVQKIWEDPKVSMLQQITAGGKTFLKESIKYVNPATDTDENAKRAKQWIIYSRKRSSIWDKPYASLEEAKQEFRFQEDSHPLWQNHDWVIEER